jgi:hypothetical protein
MSDISYIYEVPVVSCIPVGESLRDGVEKPSWED